MHLVCNNAGVGGRPGGIEELTERQWDWVLSVNLMGVVHGIAVFLPHMRGHGEGGHFLNTASMAGMLGQPHDGPYSASKAAVVGISEIPVLRIAGSNIGVSVLCPGFARTGIADQRAQRAGRSCQGGRGAPIGGRRRPRRRSVREFVAKGIEPAEVAARALQGILDGDLYIFTHPDMRPMLQKRLARIRAYDKAERRVIAAERPASGCSNQRLARSSSRRARAARMKPPPSTRALGRGRGVEDAGLAGRHAGLRRDEFDGAVGRQPRRRRLAGRAHAHGNVEAAGADVLKAAVAEPVDVAQADAARRQRLARADDDLGAARRRAR